MDPVGEKPIPQDGVPVGPTSTGKREDTRVNAKPKFPMKHPIPPGSSAKHKDGEHAVREREISDKDISSSSDSAGDSYGDYEMESASSDDTETEIAKAQAGPSKSKQTLKRKRRALQASHFGQALTELLETETPATTSRQVDVTTESTPQTHTILALQKRPSSHVLAQKSAKLEAKALKTMREGKKEAQEIKRIKDVEVMEQWGMESERALRKVATRGVVKLFNLIQQAQSQDKKSVPNRPEKPMLPARNVSGLRSEQKQGTKVKDKDRNSADTREAGLNREDFLQSIRAGAVISKI